MQIELLIITRIRQFLVITIFSILFCWNVLAQEDADSLRVVPPVGKSPSGAMLRSALIPGWGQWYTDHRLKAIIVLGAQLALVGNAVYYNQLAVKSQTSDERIFYLDYRSQFIWYSVGFYLLNILDAFIEAHLWDFDTGPDLSVGSSPGGNDGIVVRLCWSW